MHALVTALLLAGFALLAAAMERHQDDLFGRPLPARLTALLRLGGSAALLVGLAAAVQAWGWAVGPVAWFGHLSVAAGAVVLALVAWERRHAR
ncbi:DUF3325 domain-containing protein [uncultured Pseudacidovorax sp.]|uniref:DUF3325 domain-containing protein n=1 Tax=uncultured Pseudacidovorax sp. TaxID=679313 RepID=UPI0025F84DF3|nr:DUF3325 domain-containing protein [uncultured Pseudacidovorax sp.]